MPLKQSLFFITQGQTRGLGKGNSSNWLTVAKVPRSRLFLIQLKPLDMNEKYELYKITRSFIAQPSNQGIFSLSISSSKHSHFSLRPMADLRSIDQLSKEKNEQIKLICRLISWIFYAMGVQNIHLLDNV